MPKSTVKYQGHAITHSTPAMRQPAGVSIKVPKDQSESAKSGDGIVGGGSDKC